MRLVHQHRQSGTVVPWRLTSPLSKDDLLLHINHGEPFQPVLPGALLLAEVLYATDEIAAYLGLRQPGCIDGYRGRTSPPPGHASDNFVHHPRYIVPIKPGQKAYKVV